MDAFLVFQSTVYMVLKSYSNTNQLENQQNNYNVLILISRYEKLWEVLFYNPVHRQTIFESGLINII